MMIAKHLPPNKGNSKQACENRSREILSTAGQLTLKGQDTAVKASKMLIFVCKYQTSEILIADLKGLY